MNAEENTCAGDRHANKRSSFSLGVKIYKHAQPKVYRGSARIISVAKRIKRANANLF